MTWAIMTAGAFLLFSLFPFFNLVTCELSLLISFIISLITISSKMDDVFKIVMLIGLFITAVVKFLLTLFLSTHLQNNIALFVLFFIVCFEIAALLLAKNLSRFAK